MDVCAYDPVNPPLCVPIATVSASGGRPARGGPLQCSRPRPPGAAPRQARRPAYMGRLHDEYMRTLLGSKKKLPQ